MPQVNLSSWLAVALEEQIVLGADLLDDVAAGDVSEEHGELFPGHCAFKRRVRRWLSEDGGEEGKDDRVVWVEGRRGVFAGGRGGGGCARALRK